MWLDITPVHNHPAENQGNGGVPDSGAIIGSGSQAYWVRGKLRVLSAGVRTTAKRLSLLLNHLARASVELLWLHFC